MPPKPKKNSKKAILDKAKNHTKESDVFYFKFFDFLWLFLVLAVFGLFRDGLIISTLRFFWTYLAAFSLKKKRKKLNPRKF